MEGNDNREENQSPELKFVRTTEERPEGYEGSCLRPIGMCELGGCCDICWYRPDHPRFQPTSED